ncbi:unnamed protein product [Moneuplotes crassus]|uniref:Uncharacterized protein n=1 Tax=Euplotes crassus TaxID=5936 RepID=A0AAD1U6P0_EUPCR|nr:unnamed protein product [Moneuplotes crassus]
MSQKPWRSFARNFETPRVMPHENNYIVKTPKQNITIKLNTMNLQAAVPGKSINQDLMRWHENLKERIKNNKKVYQLRKKLNKGKEINLIRAYNLKVQNKIKQMQQISPGKKTKQVNPKVESQLSKSFIKHLPTCRSFKKEPTERRSVRPKVRINNPLSGTKENISAQEKIALHVPEDKHAASFIFEAKEGKLHLNELENEDKGTDIRGSRSSYSNFTSPRPTHFDNTFTQGFCRRSNSNFRAFKRKIFQNRNSMCEGLASSSCQETNFDAMKVLNSIRKFNSSSLLGNEEEPQKKKKKKRGRLNLTSRCKDNINISSDNALVTDEQANRQKKRNSYHTQLLENTFAANSLVEAGLIDDLSELRLPKLMKAPFKTRMIELDNSERSIYKMAEINKTQTEVSHASAPVSKKASLDKAVEDMIFKTDLAKLNSVLKKIISNDQRINRPSLYQKLCVKLT